MRVLDIGCGYGRLEEWLCSVVGRVDGVDVGTTAIETARKRFEHVPNVAFHEGDGFTLGMFSDATFDLVFAYTVFQHIPRGAALNYLRQARRVLKPGGRVVIQYLGARSEKEIRGDVGLEKREYGIKYTLEAVHEAGSQAGLTLLKFEREERDEGQFWYWAIYGRSVN